ncbi:MAG: hypothetical protein MK187_02640, partial [Acidimicrobiales bacterium]|nr:hypothetical protein [Acidimicrobiales bacterium]
AKARRQRVERSKAVAEEAAHDHDHENGAEDAPVDEVVEIDEVTADEVVEIDEVTADEVVVDAADEPVADETTEGTDADQSADDAQKEAN